MTTKLVLKYVFVLLSLLVFVTIYTVYNPIDIISFPKCPFREITGLMCPGCGSQRAMHYLFNFNLLYAVNENALLVISIPYIFIGLFFDSTKSPSPRMLKWRKVLYGKNAIIIVLSLVIMFWLLRNALSMYFL